MVTFALLGLIGATRYYLIHGNPAYALRLAGLVTHHPAFTSEIKAELDRALKLADTATLDQDLEAQMASGAALEFESTVNAVLTDLIRR